MSNFKPGDIVTEVNYTEAAIWCNESGKYTMKEIDQQEGQRRFQIIEIPGPTEQEKIIFRVAELKRLLVESDYVVTKISEAIVNEDQDLVKSLKEKYAKVLADRQAWRDEINSYENK